MIRPQQHRAAEIDRLPLAIFDQCLVNRLFLVRWDFGVRAPQ